MLLVAIQIFTGILNLNCSDYRIFSVACVRSFCSGYLAFIGFFCGQSGLGLMAGVDIRGLQDWYLLLDTHRLELILPGVVGGLTIFLLVRGIRHMAVLPCCIISLLVLFYSLLVYTGTSIEEVTEMGFISEAQHPPVW